MVRSPMLRSRAFAPAMRTSSRSTCSIYENVGGPRAQSPMTSPFSPDLLSGHVALVTGGGTGICRGIAMALASVGCDVAITSRRQEHLSPTVSELEGLGVRSVGYPGDVRKPDDVESVLARTVETLGRLDIVVNGAAGNFICLADQLSPNGFGTVVDIDLKGTFHVSRAAYPYLKARGGTILNI